MIKLDKITLILVLLFFLLPFCLMEGQELSLVVGSGAGSYKMKDLKAYNNFVLRPGAQARLTQSFPVYWNYNASLVFSMKKGLAVGATYSLQSTGSRISLSDYSGTYLQDQIIRSTGPGAFIELFWRKDKCRFSVGNEVGIEETSLDIIVQSSIIGSPLFRTSTSYESRNLYWQPYFMIARNWHFMSLRIYAGYRSDINKDDLENLQMHSLNDEYLYIPVDRHARADWSGVRVGLSLSVDILNILKLKFLNKKEKSAENTELVNQE